MYASIVRQIGTRCRGGMPTAVTAADRRRAAGPAIRVLTVTMLVALVGVFCSEARAARDEQHRRFLVLYSSHSVLSAYVEATEGMKAVFDDTLTPEYEFYAEYRDLERFPGPDADRRFIEEIYARYTDLRLDAIIALGPQAIAFALEHRDGFAPEAPVIFGGVTSASLEGLDLRDGFHGVVGAFELAGTLALARALQPEARRVVVLTGSAPFDKAWRARAEEEFAGVEGLAFDYVSGLTLQGFQELAAGLDRETILIVLTIFEDASGRRFIPGNAAGRIAERSSAPVYGVYSTYVGVGMVGGVFATFESIGIAVAELALRVLGGKAGASEIMSAPATPVVDWRQMERFGLDVELLPASAQLLFYDPTAWQRHRLEIMLAVGFILAQSGMIVALVVQDRRKRAAETEVASRRLELAHLSRVAQLGELSGAVAHELNQPLTSILANAEAATQLLSRRPPDMAEIRAILADIAEDDRRAARIITELRGLMTKGPTDFETIDLNDVVGATVRLARSELVVREIHVGTRLARGELPVRGNKAQLQQVLLNLMLNAADAMVELGPEARHMMIETRSRTDGWCELEVRDNGPGLAGELRESAFRAFSSTKANGLGLGLSICRTIAQAHGGTLAFEESGRGARIVLALPPR